jgi:hypothetical protein
MPKRKQLWPGEWKGVVERATEHGIKMPGSDHEIVTRALACWSCLTNFVWG